MARFRQTTGAPSFRTVVGMIRAFALSLMLWLTAAGSALACRVPIAGPAEIMGQAFVTVAIAEVLTVEPADEQRPNRAFTATLRLLETWEGFAQAGRLTLRHREATECPRRLPLPRVGEMWVVYLEWEAGEGGPATYAWPLSWAERLDTRFGGRPEAGVVDTEAP